MSEGHKPRFAGVLPQRAVSVIVTVPGTGGAAALKAAVEGLIGRGTRFPPDHRFDWARAVVEVDEVKHGEPMGVTIIKPKGGAT